MKEGDGKKEGGVGEQRTHTHTHTCPPTPSFLGVVTFVLPSPPLFSSSSFVLHYPSVLPPSFVLPSRIILLNSPSSPSFSHLSYPSSLLRLPKAPELNAVLQLPLWNHSLNSECITVNTQRDQVFSEGFPRTNCAAIAAMESQIDLWMYLQSTFDAITEGLIQYASEIFRCHRLIRQLNVSH